MSPYAQNLRDVLLLGEPWSAEVAAVQARLRHDPPDFTGAAALWRARCGAPTPSVSQVQAWIDGARHCRRLDCQPPGYTPPPKRNGRTVQVREWHAEAGSAPDGVVAERHGVSLAAVRDYRRRAKIAAFKAATPVATSKPTTP